MICASIFKILYNILGIYDCSLEEIPTSTAIVRCILQGDQFYTAVYFWYLAKSDLMFIWSGCMSNQINMAMLFLVPCKKWS